MQRARGYHAGSSSQGENLASLLAPDGTHLFLSFHNEPAASNRNKFNSKMLELRNRVVDSGKTIDWNIMRRLGQEEHMQNFMVREYWRNGELVYTCRAWERLFNIREPIYRELVLEFCSTYHFEREETDLDNDEMIKFRLGGVSRKLSLSEFAVRLGLYPAEDFQDGTISHYLRNFLNGGEKEMDEEMDFNGFWNEIGRHDFSAGNSKATHIIRPDYRLLHRLIVSSINARKEGQDKVHKKDLWCLRQIVVPNLRTNVPFCLADALTDMAGHRSHSPLVNGHIVTRLAKSFNILTPRVVSTLTECPPMGFIDIVMMKRMKIVYLGAGRQELWGDNRDIQDEPPQDQPHPGQPHVEQPHIQEDVMPDQPWDSRAAYNDLYNRMGNLELQQQRMHYEQSQMHYTLDWQQQAFTQFFGRMDPEFRPPVYQPPPPWDPDQQNPPNYQNYDDWYRRH